MLIIEYFLQQMQNGHLSMAIFSQLVLVVKKKNLFSYNIDKALLKFAAKK
jgi:hypothetical protein